MIVKIVYNGDCHESFYKNLIEELKNFDCSIESYDSRYTIEKKKGYKVKGVFGARFDPFVGIYTNEGKPKKGFYSEALECAVVNIINYLNNEIS